MRGNSFLVGQRNTGLKMSQLFLQKILCPNWALLGTDSYRNKGKWNFFVFSLANAVTWVYAQSVHAKNRKRSPVFATVKFQLEARFRVLFAFEYNHGREMPWREVSRYVVRVDSTYTICLHRQRLASAFHIPYLFISCFASVFFFVNRMNRVALDKDATRVYCMREPSEFRMRYSLLYFVWFFKHLFWWKIVRVFRAEAHAGQRRRRWRLRYT